MIIITNIRAFEIDNNTKNITNNLIFEWKNLSRQVNNIKQLKRFKHWLAWYVKLNRNYVLIGILTIGTIFVK